MAAGGVPVVAGGTERLTVIVSGTATAVMQTTWAIRRTNRLLQDGSGGVD